MSRRPQSRFHAPDWLFRFAFGPLTILGLVGFTWFISRNEPAPRPSAMEVQMRQQAEDLFHSEGGDLLLTKCTYSAKTFALYTCSLPSEPSAGFRATLQQQGWVVSREDRDHGWGGAEARIVEYSRNKQTLAIYCYKDRKECKLQLARRL